MVGNTTQEARLYQTARSGAIDELFRTASERLARAHGGALR